MSDRKVEGILKISKSRVIQREYKNINFSSKKKQLRKKNAKVPEDKCDEEYMINKSYVEEVKTALAYGDVGHGVLLDKKV